MSDIIVHVPDIGDFQDVAVIEYLVKIGDTITIDQSLITVESDKASMEIPSSHAGVVKAWQVALGDKVSQGHPILVLATQEEAPTETIQTPSDASVSTEKNEIKTEINEIKTEIPVSTPPTPTPTPSTPSTDGVTQFQQQNAQLPHASPSVRKMARELGVPLHHVAGTGAKGRITAMDVAQFTRAVMHGETQTEAIWQATQKQLAEQAQTFKTPSVQPLQTTATSAGLAWANEMLAWPKVDFAKFGPVERQPLGRIKKISGANLARNWVMVPHVTQHDMADITELEAFRQTINQEAAQRKDPNAPKITLLAFILKALVHVLKRYPEFNASLDGQDLVYKQYFHLGFAADTPQGLMVPVLKQVDQKGVGQISQEMGELAKKARQGQISPSDMQGGCFSVSSLGGIGGTYFTPIINAPEVAILGLSKNQTLPQWQGGAFVPRLMLPMSLSYDHRVIDGAQAARFTTALGELLSDFRRVLL